MTNDNFLVRQVKFTVSDRNLLLKNLDKVGKKHKVSIVCLNADMMAGIRHVRTAVSHAVNAFNRGEQIARRLEVEVLLYAAGTRQTGLIGPFGVQNGDNRCYICIIPMLGDESVVDEVISSVGGICDISDWDHFSDEKRRRLIDTFGITEEELSVVGEDRLDELVAERSALLGAHR